MAGSSKRSRTCDESTANNVESLSRPISPPRKRQKEASAISSPWQLTWIRDLPEELNRDAVTLKDLLGDPLIAECWEFNYLHDIRFLMDAFDPDTRHLVKVHVVHGFWKQEDAKRQILMQDAKAFDNVQLHVAPMPEMFGTHHTKMMVLFRHDETAQIIIHTANMIAKDWTNMTNAVWKSPILTRTACPPDLHEHCISDLPIGSGERFKADLLNYFRAYNRRRPICHDLVEKLGQYDFYEVRAALVASVPGTFNVNDTSHTPWGWAALRQILGAVESSPGPSELVVQISSIATLGAKDEWLQKTLFDSLKVCKGGATARSEFKVVFPTADEVRRSIDGYNSGASIHTKIQSQQQVKQLQYLRPLLHHWANDSPRGRRLTAEAQIRQGGRARAAPHIKTYTRFNDKGSIDWAMLTSANMSKQAWGEAKRATGDIRIASWEAGVLVWPKLIEEGSILVPCFKSDTPDKNCWDGEQRILAGLRIPYDMPLQRYGSDETPWVATMAYNEPDRLGQTWVA